MPPTLLLLRQLLWPLSVGGAVAHAIWPLQHPPTLHAASSTRGGASAHTDRPGTERRREAAIGAAPTTTGHTALHHTATSTRRGRANTASSPTSVRPKACHLRGQWRLLLLLLLRWRRCAVKNITRRGPPPPTASSARKGLKGHEATSGRWPRWGRPAAPASPSHTARGWPKAAHATTTTPRLATIAAISTGTSTGTTRRPPPKATRLGWCGLTRPRLRGVGVGRPASTGTPRGWPAAGQGIRRPASRWGPPAGSRRVASATADVSGHGCATVNTPWGPPVGRCSRMKWSVARSPVHRPTP